MAMALCDRLATWRHGTPAFLAYWCPAFSRATKNAFDVDIQRQGAYPQGRSPIYHATCATCLLRIHVPSGPPFVCFNTFVAAPLCALALAEFRSRPASESCAPQRVDIVSQVEYHADASSLANSASTVCARCTNAPQHICHTAFARLFIADSTRPVCVAPDNMRGMP